MAHVKFTCAGLHLVNFLKNLLTPLQFFAILYLRLENSDVLNRAVLAVMQQA